MLEMKKVRSKKLFGELVSELKPFMNEEGLEVLDYFGDPENIKAFKLGELKEDLSKAIDPENFANLEDFLDVAQYQYLLPYLQFLMYYLWLFELIPS